MIKDVTNLGSAALLLPASLLLFCHLYWRDNPKHAISFALATGLCLTITTLAKLAFLVWGVDCLHTRVLNPSGHASFSATFYGCCAALTASDATPWRRRFAWTAAGGLILAVAATRVLLGDRSLLEVAIGLAIGAACVSFFLFLVEKPRPAPGLLQFALGVAALATVLQGAHLTILQGTHLTILQGTHLTMEPFLRRVADQLRVVEPSRCSAVGVITLFLPVGWTRREEAPERADANGRQTFARLLL